MRRVKGKFAEGQKVGMRPRLEFSQEWGSVAGYPMGNALGWALSLYSTALANAGKFEYFGGLATNLDCSK